MGLPLIPGCKLVQEMLTTVHGLSKQKYSWDGYTHCNPGTWVYPSETGIGESVTREADDGQEVCVEVRDSTEQASEGVVTPLSQLPVKYKRHKY